MEQEQWCLRVPRSRGEAERRRLIDLDLLERGLKIRSEGEVLMIPVRYRIPGAEMGSFEILEQKEDLPRHEQIGGIAVLADEDPVQAGILLRSRPNLHTVLYATSAVEGEFRTKRFMVLAGENTTRTQYTEYGHRFFIDLAEAYFSARLSGERQRILSSMDVGECVVDMFAGVGPFAIILAQKASRVYACDINPGAIVLMTENIHLNSVSNVIPILGDACNLPSLIGKIADRVIMNLPLSGDQFLNAAMDCIKPGGTIHCYALVENNDDLIPLIRKYPVRSVDVRFVRSYSPDKFHVVYEIQT